MAGTIDYDSIAELYDIFATSAEDVPFFLAEVEKLEGGAVLELMAGTGRLSIPLVEAGANLVCVDRSEGMLAVLSRKLREGGLEAELRCEDVKRLGCSQTFRLALLPFQAFMELCSPQDQVEALESIRSRLAPEGRLICTLHNPRFRREFVDGVLRFVGRFPMEGGLLAVSGVESSRGPIVDRLQFFEFFGSDGALLWKKVLPMEFALIEPEEFEERSRGAGFERVDLFGSYDREPFDVDTSRTMIWILRNSGS